MIPDPSDAAGAGGAVDPVEVLQEVEWSPGTGSNRCPCCGHMRPHLSTCRLAAALSTPSPAAAEIAALKAEDVERLARDIEHRYPSIKKALGSEYASFREDFWRAVRDAKAHHERATAAEARCDALQARVGELEEALRPFARLGEPDPFEELARITLGDAVRLRYEIAQGDLRRARAVLSASQTRREEVT